MSSSFITPWATRALSFVVCVGGGLVGVLIGSFHNPFEVLLPFIKILLFFITFTLYFSKIVT